MIQIFPNIEGFGVWAAKCNFTMGPDGKMYSRMLGGNLVRIDVENARRRESNEWGFGWNQGW